LTFAGLGLDRPRLMGVVNVTPDSFSDGGEALRADAAVARGRALIDDGADIIDVGGESTRPGAEPVPVELELARVVPVVRALAAQGVLVSVDTRRAEVMDAALDAGARIVNDVTALADVRAAGIVAGRRASVVLMHMRGEPATMQDDPTYGDAALEVHDDLADRVAACEAAGIDKSRIAIDPGIGFGKTAAHNIDILARLNLFRDLGCAVVVGVSRKSFISRIDHPVPPKQRLAGSLAAGLAAIAAGAHILRVHEVAETRQAVAIWQAIAANNPVP